MTENIETIEHGPNMGAKFPSINGIENFSYNGFMVEVKKGFAKYTVVSLVRWTNDPGIGLFLCSDKKERLIPSCQLTREFISTQPERPELNPFKGDGVLFGSSSHS